MKKEGIVLTKGNINKRNVILITKEFTFRFLNFENLYHLLENDTKLLRETLSYLKYEEDDKFISINDFYFDKWDLSENELDLDKFLDKTHKYKGKYRIFEIRNDNELLFISDKEKVNRNDYYYEYNSHIDETEIYSYKCNDIKKLEFLKEMLEKDVNTVIIKCVLVSFDYKNNIKESMYDRFQLKTEKKVREINAPKEDVKKALRDLLIILNPSFENRKRKTNQFAYRPNLSIKDNVSIHKDNKYVLKTDITSFFDNCHSDLVFKYIYPIMFDTRYKDEKNKIRNDSLYNVLHNYLYPMIIDKETDGLYMGSPVSGVLSNMIIRPAILYLQNILEPKGFSISVYADDITVSHPKPFKSQYILDTIKYVFDYYYLPFELKEEKTRYLVNNGRRITGIRINHKDEMTIDRKQYKFMRTVLDNLSKGKAITIDFPTLEGKLNFYLFVDESGKFKKLAKKYFQVLLENKINVNVNKGQIEMNLDL